MDLVSSTKKQWLQPTIIHLDSKSTKTDPCIDAGKVGGFADGTFDLSTPSAACGTS